MTAISISLPDLLRWIAARPSPFRGPAEVRVRAVVADLHETLCGAPAPPALLEAVAAQEPGAAEENRVAWTLAACHALWHPAIRAAGARTGDLLGLLCADLPPVAAAVAVAELDQTEERREELARLTLRALGHRIEGEPAAQSEDRLRQVDSVERRRVLVEAAQRERRAREVQEAMTKRAAEEAAAKVSRE